MTTATHETEIAVDPDVPLVRITRDFAGTPAQLFRAHTDPELYARWVGPADRSVVIDHWDARTGGSWRYVSGRGDEEFAFFGSFHELRPAERIVQTFTYEGFPDGVALEILTFEELDGGRCRLRAVSVGDSVEGRDAMVASGMEHGVIEGYEKLDELLPSL